MLFDNNFGSVYVNDKLKTCITFEQTEKGKTDSLVTHKH